MNTPEYAEWFKEVRKFGKAIWDITGKGNNVDMVFEHQVNPRSLYQHLSVKKAAWL